jgi:type III secretion system low calcium response chaperone LcrH/SycD
MDEQILEHIASSPTLGDFHGLEEEDYEMLYGLGHQLYQQHRFDDAVEAFRFLATHKHSERRFIKAYASALQMTREHDAAIAQYALAGMLDPDDPAIPLHACECLIAAGRRDEAAEGLAIAMELCEGEPQHAALRQRAQALLDLLAQPAASTKEEETKHV